MTLNRWTIGQLLTSVLFASILVGIVVNFGASGSNQPATAVPLPVQLPTAVIDVTPHPIDLIPPGTVIEREPPAGWSHLIIKICPRPATGDVEKLSNSMAKLAGSFFIAVAANVEMEKPADSSPQYYLARVAAGTGMRINGRDAIVSSQTEKSQGANLGFMGRTLLGKNEARIQKVERVAYSKTLAIIDVPAFWLKDGKHVPVTRRYALLLDPKTGHLETLLWLVERDDHGRPVQCITPMEWLPPSKMEDCILHVDGTDFTLGLPGESAFAIVRLPEGRQQVSLTSDLQALAGESPFTTPSAGELEKQLRSELKEAGAWELAGR